MKKNIVETAVENGSFKRLVDAVKKAGLVDTLSGGGPFTVFAPNDDAFNKIPSGQLNDILSDKEKLRSVLTYHVIAGNVWSADAAKLRASKTLQGQSVQIDASHGVRINNATVVKADIECSNGVIHVIDTVLMPKAVEMGVPF